MKSRFPRALGALSGLLLLAGCVSGGPEGENRIHANGVMLELRILPDNAYNRAYKYGPPMEEVRFITIHNTWNFAPASNEAAYLASRRDNRKISFHYVVDEKEAFQVLPENVSGYHAGDGNGPGNRQSLGIEIARSRCIGTQEALYRRAEENAVRLAAWLLARHHLPTDALRKHQDWSGKFCPHRILEENRWEEFVERVRAADPRGSSAPRHAPGPVVVELVHAETARLDGTRMALGEVPERLLRGRLAETPSADVLLCAVKPCSFEDTANAAIFLQEQGIRRLKIRFPED